MKFLSFSRLYIQALIFSRAVTASLLLNDDKDLSQRSARGYPPTLAITGATLTSKWIEGSNYTQVVEMVITNSNKQNYLTLADTLSITIESDSLITVVPGTLTRLAPSQSAVVQVGVQNKPGVTPGSTCQATVVATYGTQYGPAITTNETISGPCGFGNYSASVSSVDYHWNPDWFNEVKFGIFIHWGLYSAPAYGSVAPNEDYAEWYWRRQHEPTYKTKTYQYHLQTYGENFNYDQFMSNFTDSNFDPQAWVDLIAAAGAKYFVPVTKHHDGFALFNFSTSISQRSSIHYGPKRDLIGDLLAAAKQYHPEIRRGTYFSLPEWYNPAYEKYAFGDFGLPNQNPYTNATIPYTGYVEVEDFVADIQVPQMEQLAYTYDTEIMWCDIGGANDMVNFASAWLNWATQQGRQVTFNNRCGIQGDFDTPEYTTNSGTVSRKWESNRGMDPFSFGYNYQTPLSSYLTGNDIIQSLVDITSKNGNFLLDIGPMHDGTIPQIMQTGLRNAGSWLQTHGEGIYSTRYWSVTPGLNNFRYTTTQNAFFIFYLQAPPSQLVIPDPVPWLPGDTVTVLGGSQNGTVLSASKNTSGNLVLNLSSAIISGDQYVWGFKIAYTSTW